MGGVLSSVSDLARWVAGFAAAFPPDGGREGNPAVDGDAPHPLRSASRREMQLPQAVTGWRAADRLPGGPPASPAYYAFGLFADEDPALGRIVSHSGGYPGFGTNMRWHPATGVGVIALANGTYAPMNGLTELVLDALLPQLAWPTTSRSRPRRPRRSPAASAPRSGRHGRRSAVAGNAGRRRGGQPPPAGLGRRHRRRAVQRERRARQPLPRAPPRHRPDPRAHRRLHPRRAGRDAGCGGIAPGRVRHPGPPPLVADRPRRHRRGADPAQPRAAAPRPVPRPRRPAGRGLGPRPRHRRRGRVAEQRRRAVARRPPRRRRRRRRPDRPPPADGRRLGGHLRGGRLPGRQWQRRSGGRARRRARHGHALAAGQPGDRRAAPGGRSRSSAT